MAIRRAVKVEVKKPVKQPVPMYELELVLRCRQKGVTPGVLAEALVKSLETAGLEVVEVCCRPHVEASNV